jgi:hypothetical protein
MSAPKEEAMAPRNSAAVAAGGVQFYLVGVSDAPPGRIVHKFQNAMIAARAALKRARQILGSPGALTEDQSLAMQYCFNPKNNDERKGTLAKLVRVIDASLTGLQTPKLEIHDVDAQTLAEHPGAEGYVRPFGNIHTRFDLEENRTAHNLIHEATHKFAGTDDGGGYISGSLATFITSMKAMAATIPGFVGNAPTRNATALQNADSHATLVMFLG